MASSEEHSQATVGANEPKRNLWRRLFGHRSHNGSQSQPEIPSEILDEFRKEDTQEAESRPSGFKRRLSRKVVPGLPRAKTFKRQQSELRDNLTPATPDPIERRTASVDRRTQQTRKSDAATLAATGPRSSAPEVARSKSYHGVAPSSLLAIRSTDVDLAKDEKQIGDQQTTAPPSVNDNDDLVEPAEQIANDKASITTSQYHNMIDDELERRWILNLSMHYKDKSKREKFFVTFDEKDSTWRRVTISVDYRDAPDNSLEMDLAHTQYQREKSAKIYEAIRESLPDIQFYSTVTNLKLQTTDGRLHVHVMEDVSEIIHFPPVRVVQHLSCRRIKEKDVHFHSHLSGFVYKVRVDGQILIKKEVPGPDTVDEFLYEVNALSTLGKSPHVIDFYGVIVDDESDHIKGLLISYAEDGALIDVLYNGDGKIPWRRREKWARQIVTGLSDIHEAGFVQGDFTLSNIVIDYDDNAQIIDINRRGCPVGWEPPELTPLIETSQRISMYIGVKSDLYQLGMVLWALAEQDDEPEMRGRPLKIARDLDLPAWYSRIMQTCLSDDPQLRLDARVVVDMFPKAEIETRFKTTTTNHDYPVISVDDGFETHEYLVHDDGYSPAASPIIKTVQTPSGWSYHNDRFAQAFANQSQYYPTRGRSPPSPMPSHLDQFEGHYTADMRKPSWRDGSYERKGDWSASEDVGHDETKASDWGSETGGPVTELAPMVDFPAISVKVADQGHGENGIQSKGSLPTKGSVAVDEPQQVTLPDYEAGEDENNNRTPTADTTDPAILITEYNPEIESHSASQTTPPAMEDPNKTPTLEDSKALGEVVPSTVRTGSSPDTIEVHEALPRTSKSQDTSQDPMLEDAPRPLDQYLVNHTPLQAGPVLSASTSADDTARTNLPETLTPKSASLTMDVLVRNPDMITGRIAA